MMSQPAELPAITTNHVAGKEAAAFIVRLERSDETTKYVCDLKELLSDGLMEATNVVMFLKTR